MFSVPPLFVIEFLHRVVDIFEDYFGECSETIIKEHYVIIFEVSETYNFLEQFVKYVLVFKCFKILFSYWMRCWTTDSHLQRNQIF